MQLIIVTFLLPSSISKQLQFCSVLIPDGCIDLHPLIKISDEKCVVILSSPDPDVKQFCSVMYLDGSLSYVEPLSFSGYLGAHTSILCLYPSIHLTFFTKTYSLKHILNVV